MSEHAAARPCQWEGCEEAATERAEHMEHLGVEQRGEVGVTIHNQITSWELCDRYFKELGERMNITEAPLNPHAF